MKKEIDQNDKSERKFAQPIGFIPPFLCGILKHLGFDRFGGHIGWHRRISYWLERP
jgi:hypothetical protein